MRALLAVSMETFLRLRRDKIFVPAALVGCGLLIMSGLASYWGVEEFIKILYDLGSFAWLMTGTTVAIFWGNKIIADSRQEGSLEVQLASPISRSTWLLGKFLGLTAALVLLSLIFLAGWQSIYLSYGMGWMPVRDVILFSLLSVSWVVMAAVSIFFASMASAAVALFCSVWMFVAGLITAPIMQTLSPDTPEGTRKAVETLAGIWNLHLFDASQYTAGKEFLSQMELLSRLGYGALLIGVFMSMACFFFNRRDIIG
ncbi:MAG TPA: ABC transporter permease subunit [Oligoflexus sp.]|uniref:ABC transporter permease subunit n=1 Tax=Oligoflexus sp. TaxID=1971216 RepID=UPI002D3A1876|nr:ABC transporter permease subunit [Oligoflexus sp.]HYX36158.1 ABC transporter permease subunit [Oligoflexus sp.]